MVADSVLLSVFPSPLARLLLCGGAGLPPAWGPLTDPDGDGPAFVLWHGEPRGPIAMSPFRHMFMPLQVVECWSLPLDATSPWPARLAMVAAWMLEEENIIAARVCFGESGYLLLELWKNEPNEEGDSLTWWDWYPYNGRGASALVLTSLPAHLAQHPPAVALLLALYDLPELRARVEGAS